MASELEKDFHTCFICNNRVEEGDKSNLDIFKRKKNETGRALIDVINDIFNINVCEKSTHSNIVCKKCYKTVTDVQEMENRASALKNELAKNFKKTSKKLAEIIPNEEEYNDHDYLDTFEPHSSSQSVPEESASDNKSVVDDLEIPEEETDDINHFEEVLTSSDKEEYMEEVASVFIKPEVIDTSPGTPSVDTDNVKSKTSEPEEVIVTRDEDDNYTCMLCDETTEAKSFDSKTIVIHMKDNHDIKLHICDLCGEDFRKRSDLTNHVNEHFNQEEGDFQCEVCNRIFNNLRLYRIHRRVHLPQVKSWACESCDKKYSSKNLLDEHMNTHTGTRPYVCTVCKKDFASKYTFKAHSKIHEVRARPFKCTECDKTFLSQQNLTQHQRTHTGVKDYVCHCGKAFGSPHNLEVHNIVHTGHKPYICNACGKAFARKAEIRDHERTHTGEKPYQCEFCGATFSQRSNLQSHKRATHLKDLRYKCDQCGKGFKRRRLLDYHIKAQHTGERPFKCTTCAATFVYPEHFKKHMRIHTGEKPYLCEVCGKAFNSRDNRNAHRFIHSDKKPYECVVCGAGFMRKPLLYAHMSAQSHLNDIIVVNQPQLTTEDEQVIAIPDNVELIMPQNSESDQEQVFQLEDRELYVMRDHVIIQENGEQLYAGGSVLNIASDESSKEGVPQFVAVDGSVSLEGALMECNSEQVFAYQEGEGGKAIVIPASKLKDRKHPIRLVQIQLPSSTADGKSLWSLVQQS